MRYNPNGTYSLTGGGVHRFVGKSYPPRIPASRPLSGSRPEAAWSPSFRPSSTNPQRGEWGAEPNGPVNVYDLTGRRLGQVVPQGTVEEVALDWPDLAVIVTRSDGTTAIERYHFAPQGRLISATTMPGASNLSIARGKVVFRVGNTIYLWWVVPQEDRPSCGARSASRSDCRSRASGSPGPRMGGSGP